MTAPVPAGGDTDPLAEALALLAEMVAHTATVRWKHGGADPLGAPYSPWKSPWREWNARHQRLLAQVVASRPAGVDERERHITDEMVAELDRAAGKVHSAEGSVMSTLRRLIAMYETSGAHGPADVALRALATPTDPVRVEGPVDEANGVFIATCALCPAAVAPTIHGADEDAVRGALGVHTRLRHGVPPWPVRALATPAESALTYTEVEQATKTLVSETWLWLTDDTQPDELVAVGRERLVRRFAERLGLRIAGAEQ